MQSEVRGTASNKGCQMLSEDSRIEQRGTNHVRIAPGSISGPGKLTLGCTWEYGADIQSQLIVKPGAKLIIEGDFRIYAGCVIAVESGAVLRINSGYANHGLRIACFGSVVIGQDAAIAQNVTIRDSDSHTISGGRDVNPRIEIGDHVWIGLNAIILKCVKIGRGAIVAAGSVVSRDVEPETLVGGSPARLIRAATWK